MKSGDLKRAKRAVRAEVRAARDALSADERARLSALIADRAMGLPELERAEVVMAFWSFGSEVDTAPLLRGLHERGRDVALPRIADGDLEPRVYTEGDPLAETSFGALEPTDGRVLEPTGIDVVVTPAVAFDRDGRRVGYGGGFYDRFFLRARPDAVRLGIAFGIQVVEHDLPGGRFDLRVDVIVTESEVVRCRRDG
jgi:5-formyltetrahydrofolate cyclo-ligase